MMTASSQRKAPADPAALPDVFRHAGRVVPALLTAAALSVSAPEGTQAEERAASPMAARVNALIPELEAYIQSGMKAFDVPGLAIGIVTGDRLVYAKGFGVRSKSGGAAVDPKTVFQIGSAAKAFLATTMAIAVDRGKFHWDDRVVDLDPDFQLKDPWVTREFRMFDLLAQRSSLPPYANDMVGILGGDAAAMMRSLRHVEPVSSFRSTFAYTNITHLWAGKIVAKAEGLPDWNAVLARGLARPARHDGQLHHRRGDRGRRQSRGRAPLDARPAPSSSRSRRSSPTVSAAPATSTPTSRMRRAGSACSSATAASRDAASSRPRISRPRAARGWRSTTRRPTGWAGSPA